MKINAKRIFMLVLCILTPWLILWTHGHGLEAVVWTVLLVLLAISFQKIGMWVMFASQARAIQVYLRQNPMDLSRVRLPGEEVNRRR